MDELTHDDAELEKDTVEDDAETPADTDEESDEPKNADAEEVKARQKKAWLENIKSGKKKIDDMPANLGWLKKEIKQELEPKKEAKKVEPDELEARIRKTLQEERAEEDFNSLVEDLETANITAEQDAELQSEYEDYLSDFPNPTYSQKLKAMLIARKVVGLKSNAENIIERRRKGRTLIPGGGRKRDTVIKKDEESAMEKKLSGNLPPGFKA